MLLVSKKRNPATGKVNGRRSASDSAYLMQAGGNVGAEVRVRCGRFEKDR